PLTFDVSQYKAGESIPIAYAIDVPSAMVNTAGSYNMLQLATAVSNGTASGVTVSNSSWTGCIEERTTVAETSFDPVPSGALDLDLDDVPNGDSTSWRPQWAALEHDRDDYTFQDYFYRSSNGRYYKNSSFSGSTYTPASSITSNCPSPMSLFETVELTGKAGDIPASLNT